ncbi:predicted protein [Histoplasma capsulatum H143]|uniref:CSC1/OSCA1-like N-terminal transmembrane domain-containing protein n=1 Tax=Ajellomyces capsulatus (strain H143) TaxID=544712 RepID=C6HRK4_AJECH|nr:predicted protein [Histoplasma capsulatum H143]
MTADFIQHFPPITTHAMQTSLSGCIYELRGVKKVIECFESINHLDLSCNTKLPLNRHKWKLFPRARNVVIHETYSRGLAPWQKLAQPRIFGHVESSTTFWSGDGKPSTGAILARQATAKSSAEEFLELIQNPFSAAFQLNAFWASFGTSLGLTIVLALCFSFVRPRNSLVYAPKIKHADRKHSPPPVGKGLLAWLTPVIQTKESNLVDCIGLDATVFLRFTRMCRNMFLVLSIIGCLVMIPVNVSQSSSPAGISAFATMTPQFVSTRAMWSHVVCLWIFDVVVVYFFLFMLKPFW